MKRISNWDFRFQIPRLQISDSRFQIPDFGFRISEQSDSMLISNSNPEFGICNLESAIWESGIRNPNSQFEICNLEFAIWTLQSGIWNLESEI